MSRAARASGLVMDVRQGEALLLGHNIRIDFLEKSGRITRIRICAPLDVRIGKDTGGVAEKTQQGQLARL